MSGNDFLRELGQFALQRRMELETDQRCGAGRHERSEERVNRRNGYRERKAYVNGISMRKVDDLVQAMGMSGISKSQVSRLCQDIDERVTRLLERPLLGEWPYLWLDATYQKSREESAPRAPAAYVVHAGAPGCHAVPGLRAALRWSEAFSR